MVCALGTLSYLQVVFPVPVGTLGDNVFLFLAFFDNFFVPLHFTPKPCRSSVNDGAKSCSLSFGLLLSSGTQFMTTFAGLCSICLNTWPESHSSCFQHLRQRCRSRPFHQLLVSRILYHVVNTCTLLAVYAILHGFLQVSGNPAGACASGTTGTTLYMLYFSHY